jgi:signal transduction histidine kinase
MSTEIQEWNEELHQRVDDRTRELKEAQKQLLESQKIAAVSSLAAGVAHEINNPLTGVLGFAQVLKSRAAKAGMDKDVEVLGRIESEARRIRDIVQTLLSFSQEYSGEGFSPFGVNAMIEDSVELVRGQVEERTIDVVTELESGLPQVRGSIGQMRQVMLHLLNNAVTACDEGGRIEVSTVLVDGELLRIRVSDDGRGISAENLGRVFEPFFTTKDDWQGRGLGLTVTYRVIEEHRGTIKIDSVEEEGTTVTILLPVTGGAHLV